MYYPPLRLLFYEVVNCNAARVRVDGQDFPSVADYHGFQVHTAGGRLRPVQSEFTV